jgi:hypothetical protein
MKQLAIAMLADRYLGNAGVHMEGLAGITPHPAPQLRTTENARLRQRPRGAVAADTSRP